MDYYQNIITEKSWKLLKALQNKYNFILIGGWAVWLYTKALKSKDVDIIVDYDGLAKLQKEFEVIKNERLKKYEIKQEEVDIDIYSPFFSNLGIPVESVVNHFISYEGFNIPKVELLLILKQYAYSQRQGSAKGEKDKIDILGLILLNDFNWKLYFKLLSEFKMMPLKKELVSLLKTTYEISELGINRHTFSIKKKNILSYF